MKPDTTFKKFSLGVVWLWVAIFVLVPFGLVVTTSFLSHSDNSLIELPFTTQNYFQLNNPIYLHILRKSLTIAGLATFICLLIGYPFAYLLARLPKHAKNLCMLLVIIPFWTSSLIRSYALIAIMKGKGLLNALLLYLGIIHQPLALMFTNTAVVVGLVYNLLPFMILPLLTNIERLDKRLIDAGFDLGASRLTVFRRIIIPLSMPGIIAGCTLVFLPAMTLFYITDILGGAKSILAGNLIQNKFLVAENWPMGAALSVVMTLLLGLLIALHLWSTRGRKKREWI